MNAKPTTLDKIAILMFFVLLTMATLCFGIAPVNGTARYTDLNSDVNETYALVSFTAKPAMNKNHIYWSAASSKDNYYFILERSVDGEHYSVINITKGQESTGSKALDYSYTDETAPASENIYYRIKLQEIQAIEMEGKTPIISDKNVFEHVKKASIMISNKGQKFFSNL